MKLDAAPALTFDDFALRKVCVDRCKGRCGLTLNHTRIQSRADADRMRAGWGAAFERLKSLLEGGA